MTTRGPGQRAGLDREAVLAAAQQLLAESGLAGLSMRALARALAVAPNALYSHVASKTELLDALCDDLLGRVEPPAVDAADAQAAAAELMAASYDVLVSRPDLVPLFLVRQGARGPHAVALGEVLDALLARIGLPTEGIAPARRTLIVHTIGSAAFDTGSGDAAGTARARDTFARSLRWLLAGIAADARV